MSRQHVIRLDLMAVVFLGGCVGTGLRYALSTASGVGAVHVGTIAANMIACFVYATLSAWLGSSTVLKDRAREYVNRGFGMGMCGGLSTMSTLAVEEFTLLRTSAVAGAIVYCLTTFVAGFVIAYAGACLGSIVGRPMCDGCHSSDCNVLVWRSRRIGPLCLRFLHQSDLA